LFFWARGRGRFVGGILDCRCDRVNPKRFQDPELLVINPLNTLICLFKLFWIDSTGQNEFLTKTLPGNEDFSKSRLERP